MWGAQTEPGGETEMLTAGVLLANTVMLMVLDDLSEVAGRPDDQRSAARYLRPQSRDEASQMLQLMAEGRLDSVRDAPWVAEEEVSPFRLELFRSRR